MDSQSLGLGLELYKARVDYSVSLAASESKASIILISYAKFDGGLPRLLRRYAIIEMPLPLN
jgi:hypothetical protein